MKNFILLFLISFLATGCIVTPDGPEGQQQTTDEVLPTFDVTTTNEISLPLTPQEAENEFEQAKTWMAGASHVAHDDNNPDVYYVKIFLTNESQYYNLLKYYIMYSPLPFTVLETNSSLQCYSNVSGLITGNGYTNVFPVYALITSLHYNAFLDEPIFIFKSIRKVTHEELARFNYNGDFVKDYDERLTALGMAPVKGKGIADWLANAAANAWKTITDLVGNISVTIGNILFNSCNLIGSVSYAGHETSMNIDLNGRLPGVIVRFGYWLGTVSKVADENGNYSVQLPRGNTFTMSVELIADYGKVVDKSSANIFPYIYFLGNITIPQANSCRKDANFNNPYGFLMGMTYNLNRFAKSSGILNGNIPPVKVKADKTFMSGGAGEYDDIYLMNLVWDEPSITIKQDYVYDIGVIAHEYGHFLHISGVKKYGYDGMILPINGKILYPDGSLDPLYYDNEFSLLTEAAADFYSIIYRISKFSSQFPSTFFENNFGSKEVLFYSTISNDKTIGKNNDGKYLYNYDFKRFYKEASILYDIWDNNSLPQWYYSYNRDCGARANSVNLLIFSNFSDGAYTNSEYFSSNYIQSAMQNREVALDTASVPIRNIFDMLTKVEPFTGSSPFSPISNFTTRVSNSASILGISQAQINDILLLHSLVDPTPYSNSVIISNTNLLPTNGLVAYYPFNGNCIDDSDGTNDIQNNGANLYSDRFGRANHAYRFIGGNYMYVGMQTSDDNTFSWVFWFKDESTTINNHRWFTTTTFLFASNDIMIRESKNPNNIQLSVGSFTIYATNNSYWKDGRWHMYVITSDGLLTRLYYDTNLLITLSNSICPRNGLCIGGYYIFPENIFGVSEYEYSKGIFDDIRIYNYSISLSDINSLFHENGW